MASETPFVVEVEGLEEIEEAFEEFHDDWQPIATRALTPGLAVLVNYVRQHARSDIGQARASFGSQTHKFGTHEIRKMGSQIVGVIGSRLDYAPYALEYGRGPGKMPPVSRIEEWASRHGMVGAGFAIARAIAIRGVEAPKTVSNAVRNKTREAVKKFEEGIARELKRLKLED